MFNIQRLLKRKYFFLGGIFVLAIILLGIIEPVLLKRNEAEWGTTLESRVKELKWEITSFYAGNEKDLNTKLSSLISGIEAKKESEGFSSILNSDEWKGYSILLLDSYGWTVAFSNFNENIFPLNIYNSKPGAMFYVQTALIDYLAVTGKLNYGGNGYTIVLGLPVEKKYSLNTSYFEPVSLTDDFTRKYQTKFEIHPGTEEVKIVDGREQSVAVYNSANEKIATVVFETPTLSVDQEKIREVISLLQLIFLLALIIVLLIKLKDWLGKISSREVQSLIVILLIAGFRVLFFIFEIPTRFISGELSDATFFSSAFGFGIVRSPLDLFLTVLSILCITIIVYDLVRNAGDEFFAGNNTARYTAGGVIIVFYFLLLRAFGASIRSVVYDSTLKYFKDPFLIPDPTLFVMHINVLLIGLSVVLLAVSSLLLFFRLGGGKKKYYFLFLFVVLQVLGFIYDIIQSDPQGSNFTRSFYIIFTYALAYYIFTKKTKSVFEYSIFLVIASFLSIILLNHYNKRLERTSLPATAQEFLRGNEKLNEFIAIQTAVQFSRENELIERFRSGENNFDPYSFKLWSESVLPREILSLHISILDTRLNELGHYDYNFENHNPIEWDTKKEQDYQVKNIEDPYSGNLVFAVLAPVKHDDVLLGYVEIAIHPLNNYFNRKQCYNILSSYNQRLNSTVDFSQLIAFLISDRDIASSIGNISLNQSDIEYFRGKLKSEGDEIYVSRKIEGKSYLIFLQKNKPELGGGFIGVALRTRDLTVDLFDFFKVFFIHSLLILAFTILLFIFRIKLLWKTLFNFRARLLYSLIIISIVPLFLSALYFKSLVEEKNQDDVNYKLQRRAMQIERYLQNYFSESSLIQNEVFDKAHRDLGSEFTLYENDWILYTTLPGFYKSALLPYALNSFVKENISDKEGKQVLIDENIDGYKFKSFYLKTNYGGKSIIINVNSPFNEVNLSLSNLEVDIFLFGSYSFAAVMIILFSSFLAGQISKPIRELTRATTAVAAGDLDVKVDYRDKGEMNNLIEGFNEMVEKLKQSQLELAEFERETAWKEMARQVAHEIKNPLTPMKLSIQQLVASYNDKSPKFNSIFEKVTSTIIGQIETLSKIASEFSAFARMPKLKIEKVDVKKICAEAVSLFDSDLHIKVACGYETVEVMADSDHLKRSLINLIRNSIQAGARHMEIKITMSGENIELRLADDGSGIAKENIERIFDDNFTTREKGMGLGLSMAKKYFESIKGSISVASTSGKGTEFLIIIPKTAGM